MKKTTSPKNYKVPTLYEYKTQLDTVGKSYLFKIADELDRIDTLKLTTYFRSITTTENTLSITFLLGDVKLWNYLINMGGFDLYSIDENGCPTSWIQYNFTEPPKIKHDFFSHASNDIATITITGTYESIPKCIKDTPCKK